MHMAKILNVVQHLGFLFVSEVVLFKMTTRKDLYEFLRDSKLNKNISDMFKTEAIGLNCSNI